MQDNFAVQSFERGIAAQEAGDFTWKIVSVEVLSERGKPYTVVDKDEGLGKFNGAKLRKLRPSFKETDGTVTVGKDSNIRKNLMYIVELFLWGILLGVVELVYWLLYLGY